MDANLLVKMGKGLSDIKQCELYFKWREFLPFQFQDITCPRPSDEVLTRHFKKTTDKRKVKQEGKKDAKKRSAKHEEENEAKKICLQLDEDDNDSVDGLLIDMMEESN